MRESITPDEKISLFLRYLATGEPFRSLEFTISCRSISQIVIKEVNSIITEMQNTYLKTPNNENEWIEISEMLIIETKWRRKKFKSFFGSISAFLFLNFSPWGLHIIQ